MPASSNVPQDISTPAVVLGCFRQGGIGIVRSLGRLGVPVYAIDADRFAAAFFSRFCLGTFLWDIDRSSADESLQFLTRVGNKIGRRAVLIPTSDIGAMFVATNAKQLADRFLFPEQPESLMRSLCSKRGMHDIAKRFNVPTPETSFPASEEDVRSYMSTARFPILVKPLYNKPSTAGVRSWHMFLAHTEQELLDRYRAIEDPLDSNVILQEYIPGPDSSTWTFNGYFDRDSRCLAAFTGRKLRNFPAYFGQGSLAICQRNDEVKQSAIEFMQRIGYRGALDIGFRYDCRDGRYKVNDVNPRVGAMFRVFVGRNGMDTVRALYLDLTNQAVISSSPEEGRRWIVEDVDWISAIRYWRDGNLTFKDWFRSVSGINETAFFARDDLLPFGAVCMQNVTRAFSAGHDLIKRKLYQTEAAVTTCPTPRPPQPEIK
jgi:D-aspartate ligase